MLLIAMYAGNSTLSWAPPERCGGAEAVRATRLSGDEQVLFLRLYYVSLRTVLRTKMTLLLLNAARIYASACSRGALRHYSICPKPSAASTATCER